MSHSQQKPIISKYINNKTTFGCAKIKVNMLDTIMETVSN